MSETCYVSSRNAADVAAVLRSLQSAPPALEHSPLVAATPLPR